MSQIARQRETTTNSSHNDGERQQSFACSARDNGLLHDQQEKQRSFPWAAEEITPFAMPSEVQDSSNLIMEGETSWSDDEYGNNNRRGTGVFHPNLGLTDDDDKESNLISIDLVLPEHLQEQDSSSFIVEGDTSWSDDEFDNNINGTGVFLPYLELIDDDDKESNLISIDLVLPDHLQERILASLPVACIFKACCVCKKWNEIVHSRKFILNNASVLSLKPWYFMFTSSDEPLGYVYDSILRKWYSFELSFIIKHTWINAPSCGLVCFMDEDSSSELYVCNPITRTYKKLDEPSGPRDCVYSTLAFSVERSSHKYTVAVVRCRQASDDYLQWDISIHIYYSETMTWLPPVVGSLVGWRAGNDSIICDGVLYFLVFSTRTGDTQNCHGLLTYNLNSSSSNGELIDTLISVPCSLTCGRLMNLQEKLVMVGGIGRQDRPGIIKGIGIWVLNGRDWEEVSRIPHKFFQGFGELDDVFASSGAGDLIYIQSYGATALLVFDMNLKQWSWSQKCPMTKKFPLQIFSGFCFEPRLEISA